MATAGGGPGPWVLSAALVTLAALVWAFGLRRRLQRSLRTLTRLQGETWDWEIRADRLRVPSDVLALTGWSARECGASLAELSRHVPPAERAGLAARLRAQLAGTAGELNLEFKLECRDGRHRWLSIRGTVERDEAGVATRASGIWTDVTARVEAEEERDRLFNVSLDLLAVGGFDGTLQQVNPAWVRVLGWSRDDLMSRPVLEFIHPEDRALTAAAQLALAQGRVVADLRTRFRCRDGAHRWLSWSSFPYPDRHLVFSVVRDITEQKDAERRLLEYQDRLRAFSVRLAVAEERERRQLAVAVHDGLAQLLFAARAKVTLLKYPGKTGDQARLVDEALGILDDSLRQARSLSFELYPPVLHEAGLDAALAWLARQWTERTGIACAVRSTEGAADPLTLSEDLRGLIYQCARELLTNVAKHAQATRVDVTLIHGDEALQLVVEDDGRGLSADRESAAAREELPGFGLFSVRERLRSVGGGLHLHSRTGAGLRVELTVPLRAGRCDTGAEA
ncbi:PAS domain S-box protein [bacterium]|nr:PAS domain S-box protein [bacterium]